MVAARRRHHAWRRNRPRQQIGERTACLERTAELREFQLERERKRLEADLAAVGAEYRRLANVRSDDPVDARDLGSIKVGPHLLILLRMPYVNVGQSVIGPSARSHFPNRRMTGSISR